MDIVIAAQTEGELRFGAAVGVWGTQPMAALESNLLHTPTLPVGAKVIRSFATLRAQC